MKNKYITPQIIFHKISIENVCQFVQGSGEEFGAKRATPNTSGNGYLKYIFDDEEQ